jgi:hypothetical protein
MRLFPSRTQCIKNIQCFPETDATRLAQIWTALVNEPLTLQIVEVQDQILALLRRWKAFRNQPAPRNDRFLQELTEDQTVVDALAIIINAARTSTSLAAILENEKAIETTYNFLKYHMLQNGTPTRIVTVSKALLMISGFTLAFDSEVLKRIKKSNSNMLTCSGVWPFCLFLETLQFIATEQSAWEQDNGRMIELIPSVPIGQVMDRILWPSN